LARAPPPSHKILEQELCRSRGHGKSAIPHIADSRAPLVVRTIENHTLCKTAVGVDLLVLAAAARGRLDCRTGPTASSGGRLRTPGRDSSRGRGGSPRVERFQRATVTGGDRAPLHLERRRQHVV